MFSTPVWGGGILALARKKIVYFYGLTGADTLRMRGLGQQWPGHAPFFSGMKETKKDTAGEASGLVKLPAAGQPGADCVARGRVLPQRHTTAELALSDRLSIPARWL